MTAVGLGQQGSQAVGSGVRVTALLKKLYDLSLTFFDTRIYWNTKGFLRKTSALWDKKFLTENREAPLPALLSKPFRDPKLMKHKKIHPLRKFLALWDKKTSTENPDTRPLPSYPQTLSLQDYFWNTAQKSSPKKSFGTERQKLFDKKSKIVT